VAKNIGRLELTWTNKHLTLLAEAEGGYRWVDPADVRVSEVRLLDEEDTVGDVDASGDAETDNLLICGDSLAALRSLRHLPTFKSQYAGKIKLVYIDPPFNTGQAFENYDDALEHSVWLTMIRDRIVEIKHLLAPDASIWVHLDDAEQHRARLILDEIFGERAFVTTVVWQKRTTRESRSAFSSAHDVIHVYAPLGPERWKAVRNRVARSAQDYKNPDDDPRGPWRDGGPFTAPGYRENQRYVIVNEAGTELIPTKRTRSWFATEPVYKEMRAEGRIFFTKGGAGQPRMKEYKVEEKGLVPFTFWQDDQDINEEGNGLVLQASDVGANDDAKRHSQAMFEEEFSTPKPERLMERIIHIATSPGNIVLDCFAGSGTTAAVAHKMGRQWVTIERERSTVDSYTRPRLEMVVAGNDQGGISESVGWTGGGSFRNLSLGESMYEVGDDGEVFLSESVTNGRFASAVCAQLGFEAVDEPPFCGRKGRTLLAVFDGAVGLPEARYLLGGLGEKERLMLVAKAVDSEVELLMSEVSPGSRVKKAPRDLIRAGAKRVVR